MSSESTNPSSSATLPPTMKAAIRTGLTGFTMDFTTDLPTPRLASNARDSVVVKVHAAALNPVDYKLPRAILGRIVGLDLCGTVVLASEDAPFKVGDVVVGSATMGRWGALAEYALCPASKMALLNSNWTVEQGAAMPVACATALEGFEQAGILAKYRSDNQKPPIDSLLVIGASGGCGLLALQMAKGLGIPRIIGICSSKNADFILANGATEVVPYDNAESFNQFVKDNAGQINVIYDAASYSGGEGETYSNNPQMVALLKKEADTPSQSSYIMLNGSKLQKVKAVTLGVMLGMKSQQSMIVLPKFTTDILALGMELLDKAGCKPIVDASHPFTKEGVLEGYQKLKSRRAKGKIVYSISQPSV